MAWPNSRWRSDTGASRAGSTSRKQDSRLQQRIPDSPQPWRPCGDVEPRMAGSHTDINEGKLSDPLTGLRNRVYFLDKVECSIEIANGRDDGGFAVLFIDLDRFKMINDTLGHASGDQFLIQAAGRLRASVRSEYRLGGASVVAR